MTAPAQPWSPVAELKRAAAYAVGQCTQFIYDSAAWVQTTWGDAKDWAKSAAAAGYTVNNQPSLGSIAVWQPGTGGAAAGGAGHVALVVGTQDNGLPIVEEQNWGANGVGLGHPDVRALTAQEAQSASYIQAPAGVAVVGHQVTSAQAPAENTPYYGSGPALVESQTIADSNAAPFDPVGAATGWVAGKIADPVVNALGQAVGGVVANLGGGIAHMLGVTATDVGTFMRNNLVPFIVAGVVLVVLMG